MNLYLNKAHGDVTCVPLKGLSRRTLDLLLGFANPRSFCFCGFQSSKPLPPPQQKYKKWKNKSGKQKHRLWSPVIDGQVGHAVHDAVVECPKGKLAAWEDDGSLALGILLKDYVFL